MRSGYRVIYGIFILLAITAGQTLFAQDGKLKIKVRPPQAYAFVDGTAAGQANRTLTLAPGEHKVELRNYGYKPATRTVTISSRETAKLEVELEAVSDNVSGPWGCITIEGASRDAVLLNGKTADYFAGHGDEFNHEWWWKQELVVPPGTHQLTVLRQGKEIWSGPVEVPANQRVVVDIPKGVRKTVPWSRGEKLSPSPRFHAGTASARVAVAKPSARLAAAATSVNCGDSTQLQWASSDAAQAEIAGIGPVAVSGEKAVQPKQSTTYELKASGPGGTATANTMVNVNSAIQAQLGLTPAEVRYKRVGDKVVEQGSANLNWSVSNGSAMIDPLGTVGTSGNRTLQATPGKTGLGPVDEKVTYTLTATNPCGGTETRTAVLRIVGSIEAEPELALRSVFFATDKPRGRRLQTGLAASQQEMLKQVAESFKKSLAGKPDARLSVIGYADKRGDAGYNKALSERRAEAAKAVLIAEGVPADRIDMQALGASRNLSTEQVKQLVEQNPELSEQLRKQALAKMTTLVLAHNRRVDIAVTGSEKEPVRQYPFAATDYSTLVDRGGPAPEAALSSAAGKN